MNLFVCYLCGYQSKHKSNLKAHMAAHTGGRTKLGRTLESWDHKSPSPPHMKPSSNNSERGSSACESCDYASSETRKHAVKKSYKCGSCDYKTGSSSNLKAHMKLHPTEKQRTPELWGYSQDHAGVLSTLKRGQTVKKTCDCRSCFFACNGMASLMSHKKSHLHEKSHAFRSCHHKRSGFLSLLRRSMTPSFGPKRYACELCDCSNNNSEYSSTLMQTCNGEKPLSCGPCDYACNDICTERSYAGGCEYRRDNACTKNPTECDYEYSCIRTGDLKKLTITQSGEKTNKHGSRDYRCIQAEQFRSRSKINRSGKPNPYGFLDYPHNEVADMSTLLRTHPLEQPYAVVLVTEDTIPPW